jgi:hypothetical protein
MLRLARGGPAICRPFNAVVSLRASGALHALRAWCSCSARSLYALPWRCSTNAATAVVLLQKSVLNLRVDLV